VEIGKNYERFVTSTKTKFFYDDVMQVISIAPPFFFFFSSFALGLVNHSSIRALHP
jgi:hypothetical protein